MSFHLQHTNHIKHKVIVLRLKFGGFRAIQITRKPVILREKIMTDKLMNIFNNYFFCRLQLVIETFGHSSLCTNQQNKIQAPKVVKAVKQAKKRYCKTLGKSVINSPLPPLYFFSLMENVKTTCLSVKTHKNCTNNDYKWVKR